MAWHALGIVNLNKQASEITSPFNGTAWHKTNSYANLAVTFGDDNCETASLHDLLRQSTIKLT